MKVLLLNGSVHEDGNTYTALEEVGKQLEKNGIEYEIFQIGTNPIRDCQACLKCKRDGCYFDDDICNRFIEKAKEADGFVFGSPVYYAHPSGRILSLLDRAFYSSSSVFAYKPYASVAVCRRAGADTTFDVLNKYATINNMFLIGSSYWNNVFGAKKGEAKMDEEGLQTMRNLANNMAYILKCIEKGKENGVEKPEREHSHYLNFIR